jgi:hypothetical protein
VEESTFVLPVTQRRVRTNLWKPDIFNMRLRCIVYILQELSFILTAGVAQSV